VSFAANDHDGAGAVDGRQGSPGDDAAAVAELRRCAADIITDHLAEITSTGINLTSERHLDADIICAATGLNVLAIGGIGLTVDGREITLSDTVAHKGRMLSGVPNFALTVGYTNASWTLKADLVAHDVCRLLRYMAAGGYQVVTPIAPELGPGELAPLIDLDAGYIRRSIDALPRRGRPRRGEWRTSPTNTPLRGPAGNWPGPTRRRRCSSTTPGRRWAGASTN